jgi:hypothetical protein
VRAVGLHFPGYVAAIQALHLINVALVWWLARILGARTAGCWAAALLYAFHIAAFDIYWKPMYVFDLTCATLVLLTLITYRRGPLILSFLLFWLALKAKESAILLPVALLAIEWWLGERRWKRTLPFFALSGFLGVRAYFTGFPAGENPYTLHFAPAAIWACAKYYASELAHAPYVGFAVLALPFVWRNKLVRAGVITFLVLLIPMLAVPGRLFAAYLYVPLIGLALAIAAATRPAWIALFFAVWIPWNYLPLRNERRTELAAADERRNWFNDVRDYVRDHPSTDTYVFAGEPESFNRHGITGTFRLLRLGADTHVAWSEDADVQKFYATPHCAVIFWEYARHRAKVYEYRP